MLVQSIKVFQTIFQQKKQTQLEMTPSNAKECDNSKLKSDRREESILTGVEAILTELYKTLYQYFTFTHIAFVCSSLRRHHSFIQLKTGKIYYVMNN